MAEAKRDNNRVPVIIGTSNADGSTPLLIYVDSSTNRLLVSATTDIGLAEDTAHQSGDTGVMMLAVRQDSQSNFGADGDYVPLSIDSSGALRVSGGGGGTEYTEDAAKSGNAAGGTVMMVRDDALSTITPIEGDWNPLRSSAEGALWVQDFNSDANLTAVQAIQTAVEGTLPISAASLPLPSGASTAANQSTIIGHVDGIEGLLTTIDADTGNIATAVSAIQTAAEIMDDWDNGASDGASVSGDVAHDSADAGEPVKIGGKAVTTPPTAVADDDRVNAQFDIYGRQVVIGGLREMKGSQITTITSSTSETTVVTADATYKQDVYAVIITNTSATDTEVSFKDDTAGTTRFTISAPANDTRGFMLPMDAAHKQGAANDNWTATCADSVASIIITVMFVKNL